MRSYEDRQEVWLFFLLAELQKAAQSQKRGTSPEAQTNTVAAAEQTVNSDAYNDDNNGCLCV